MEDVRNRRGVDRPSPSGPGRYHPLQPRMDRAHQPVQLSRIHATASSKSPVATPSGGDGNCVDRLKPIRGRRHAPNVEIVAKLPPKLVQRTRHFIVDIHTGPDPLPASQVAADCGVTPIEEAHERQSPVTPAGAPDLDVDLRAAPFLGDLHGHVGEGIVVEYRRPEPDVLPARCCRTRYRRPRPPQPCPPRGRPRRRPGRTTSVRVRTRGCTIMCLAVSR